MIKEMHPGMRYVLYVWKNPPNIEKNKRNESRAITSNGKEKVVWETVYETSVSIDSEAVLFDLMDDKELARAVKTFSHTSSYTDEYQEPSSNFILQVFDTIDALSTILSGPRDKYPPVDLYSIDRELEDYVYYFLAKINKKNS